MKYISGDDIASVFDYTGFLPVLQEAFCADYEVPQRHHYEYQNGVGENTSTLLLMPAWSQGEYVGIKTVTVSPYNGQFDLPSIQGIYTLINAKNGLVETQMDAKALTTRRTAATSALASSFLSRKDSKVLLMVGTGALAPELIKAHCSVRNIEKVLIWGRNPEKAEQLKVALQGINAEVSTVSSLEEGVKQANIISVATLSLVPLVLGDWLQPGQHLDLVGAYRPDMRETDDAALLKSSLFIDHEGALKESGDLAIPLKDAVIKADDVKADLKALCAGAQPGRINEEEITLFKSVGHALEDLSGALYILKGLRQQWDKG